MELRRTFTVPVPVDPAWDALLDPRRIAPALRHLARRRSQS
jgi:carbon monoxide dehydrogenase subunit G